MSADVALDARGLWMRYRRRGRWALEDVDLELHSGTTTALVGPNGAGKSTLIKVWVGYEKATRGEASVFGADPWRQRRTAITRVGYVPQATALYRDLTVNDHLSLAVSLRPGFDRPYAERRLGELDIPLRSPASELSGGQAAQVALALALGTRADVLLLDEPLAALDPLARREFLAVVGSANRADGTTVVLSSHVITDVEQACANVIVLGRGRLLLHEPLASAVDGHRIGPAAAAGPWRGLEPVAEFPDGRGEPERLWRRMVGERDEPEPPEPPELRRPSVEEVVMGYLAASRGSASDPS
jgi:ABC-2 type transport system ATP-binding protein